MRERSGAPTLRGNGRGARRNLDALPLKKKKKKKKKKKNTPSRRTRF